MRSPFPVWPSPCSPFSRDSFYFMDNGRGRLVCAAGSSAKSGLQQRSVSAGSSIVSDILHILWYLHHQPIAHSVPHSLPFFHPSQQPNPAFSQLPVPASAWSGVHKNVRSPADLTPTYFPFFEQARHTYHHSSRSRRSHSLIHSPFPCQSFSVAPSIRSLTLRSRTRDDFHQLSIPPKFSPIRFPAL